jgi:hypothetical protein
LPNTTKPAALSLLQHQRHAVERRQVVAPLKSSSRVTAEVGRHGDERADARFEPVDVVEVGVEQFEG